MDAHQERKLVEILDHLGEAVVEAGKSSQLGEVARHVGRIEYMIWEARTLLGLPEIAGLSPL
jgi:hypothetical protein